MLAFKGIVSISESATKNHGLYIHAKLLNTWPLNGPALNHIESRVIQPGYNSFR